MSKIVHTEIITNNAKATADFVGKMFGWKVEKFSPGGMEYYTWNYPGEQMGGGGIGNVSEMEGQKAPYISIYIDVDNIAASIEKAKSLGATVAMGETEIPDDMGYFAVLQVPGGANIGIWSKTPSMKSESKQTVSQKR